MSDVLKEFEKEKEKEKGKYDDLIQNVKNNSTAIMNSLRLFELSVRYETRKLLKMSDQEIRIEKSAIKDELIRLMFSIHVAEEVIRKNGLNEEYQKMAEEVMKVVGQRIKPEVKAEDAEESEVITGDESKTERGEEIILYPHGSKEIK
jgi:hypothetical protein